MNDGSTAELILLAYRCVEAADFDTLRDVLHADVVCIEPTEFPGGGMHEGRVAAVSYFQASRSLWSELRCIVHELETDDGEALAIVEHRGTLHATGDDFSITIADILRVGEPGPTIVSVQGFVDPTAGRRAWKARA